MFSYQWRIQGTTGEGMEGGGELNIFEIAVFFLAHAPRNFPFRRKENTKIFRIYTLL